MGLTGYCSHGRDAENKEIAHFLLVEIETHFVENKESK
jgi:hypothetical protein